MKKIILTGGMLIAIATASFAQNNTTTVVQTDGARNSAITNQKGQNLNATINQTNVLTTDNKAEIIQTGRGSSATIIEKGKFNEVLINQANTTNASHEANVNIAGNDSEENLIDVIQTGKAMEADIDVEGDNNIITFTQSGDTNKGDLNMLGNGLNDDNTVSITQMGDKNQSSVILRGDGNTVTVRQNGSNNTIGRFAAGGNLAVDFIPGAPVGGVTVVVAAVGITIADDITVQGDDNTVTVTQGANTRTNQAAILIQGTGGGGANADANDNVASITQSDNAENNKAVIKVEPGQDRNTSTIIQSGNALFNEAGIRQYGSDDFATISQQGSFNSAIIEQAAVTVIGSNNATINQVAGATNNNAYVLQEGIRGSTATITQMQDGGTVALFQREQGEHVATIVQDSDISGARLVLQQNGRRNTATLTQTDINFFATDVEIIQNGQNNTVTGLTNPGNQRVTQNGNGNVAAY